MYLPALALLSLLATPLLAAEVTTEYTKTVDCTRKTTRGDQISVHYRGTLASDGSEFDSSYSRSQPLTFTVGRGQVIKGWDEGLLNMCIGDQRKLTIPPEFGYGDRAMGGKIPGGSTLGEFFLSFLVLFFLMGEGIGMALGMGWWANVCVVFETELMDIEGVDKSEL